jgi:glycosyltransferase involved in cell wall biosynthesis
MKVLAFPRDPNPYQELLYSEAVVLGAEVTYLGKVTPLDSLNLLLLPVELAVRRMGGARIVHLHWVWAFLFPWADRFPLLRRASWGWFRLCLRVIRLLGLRLAWTAHNVLPHSPVFPDDIAARRLLVSHCDVVFGHSSWTSSGLTEIGAVPRRWVMIRHAPFESASPSCAHVSPTSRPSRTSGTRELLFFGKVFEYKGVEDLLEALARLPESLRVHLTVAGQCGDAGLRSRIEASARKAGDRVSLRLQHIPDSDIGQLMRQADVVALPFRRITTSGSALLALNYGKPLVIPALPALADLPDGAAFRYDGSVEGLAETLQAVIAADDSLLARMSAAAVAYCSEATWTEAASTTVAEFRKALALERLVGRTGALRLCSPLDSSPSLEPESARYFCVPVTRRALSQQTLVQDWSQAANTGTESYDVCSFLTLPTSRASPAHGVSAARGCAWPSARAAQGATHLPTCPPSIPDTVPAAWPCRIPWRTWPPIRPR